MLSELYLFALLFKCPVVSVEHTQRELERVVQIIFEELEDTLGLAAREWKKKGRIQKIIRENKWTPDELVAELIKAAKTKP